MKTGNTFISHVRTIPRRGRGAALAAGAALALGALAPVPAASAAAPGSITGVVTDAATEAGLAGIEVTVIDTDMWGDVIVGTDITDGTGAYQVDGVDPGVVSNPNKVMVRFSDPSGDHATEYWKDSIGRPPYGSWVTVPAGGVTPGIDAQLEPGSTLSGRLTSATTNAPVSGGEVSLWWQVGPQSFNRLGTYSTGADGRWTIPGVHEASYALSFRDPATGASEWWIDGAEFTQSTPVHVVASEDVDNLDAALGGFVKNTSAPTITGTPQVGSTLTAGPGTWTPSGTTVTYRWVVGDDTSPADDPTGATYVPTAADLGKTIRVQATSTRGPGWTPASAWSATTAAVTAKPLPAVASTKLPVIKGKLRVGKVVRVTKGAWTPYPQDLDYAWYANGKLIKSAHRQWFELTRKQVGKRLVVEVTASAPSYQPVTVRTARTAKVRR